MMHSYEGEIDAGGQIRLLEPVNLHAPCRVVVTVLEPLKAADVQTRPTDEGSDWRRFVGVIKDSPHFNDDPVAIQKEMRDEWN